MSPLTVPKLLLCCRTRALLPFFLSVMMKMQGLRFARVASPVAAVWTRRCRVEATLFSLSDNNIHDGTSLILPFW